MRPSGSAELVTNVVTARKPRGRALPEAFRLLGGRLQPAIVAEAAILATGGDWTCHLS